jgi:hypothetical protein
VPNPSSSREALLEQTFSLFWRHLGWWILLLTPSAVSAVAVYVLMERAREVLLPDAPAPVIAATTVMPEIAALAWLLGGAIGSQVIALRAAALRSAALGGDAGAWPSITDVFGQLAPRLAAVVATSVLVTVHVAAIGALGAGVAAALAALPLSVLPRWGVSDGTARSIALLVLLPLLVAGAIPTFWWFGRHALAIPVAALEHVSPWAALRAARHATRGRLGSVLGLFIVTSVFSNVFVLLSRMVGSLGTLLVAPDRFRPIFGEGPLKSADGAIVQLGATLLAAFVTLPLMLLPFGVLTMAFYSQTQSRGAGEREVGRTGGRENGRTAGR